MPIENFSAAGTAAALLPEPTAMECYKKDAEFLGDSNEEDFDEESEIAACQDAYLDYISTPEMDAEWHAEIEEEEVDAKDSAEYHARYAARQARIDELTALGPSMTVEMAQEVSELVFYGEMDALDQQGSGASSSDRHRGWMSGIQLLLNAGCPIHVAFEALERPSAGFMADALGIELPTTKSTVCLQCIAGQRKSSGRLYCDGLSFNPETSAIEPIPCGSEPKMCIWTFERLTLGNRTAEELAVLREEIAQ